MMPVQINLHLPVSGEAYQSASFVVRKWPTTKEQISKIISKINTQPEIKYLQGEERKTVCLELMRKAALNHKCGDVENLPSPTPKYK